MTNNEFGVEYDEIAINKVRYHRTDGRWLIEYRRKPRWFLGLDRWWWFNDGTYTHYCDAIDRVKTLLNDGIVRKAQFQKIKTYEVEQ